MKDYDGDFRGVQQQIDDAGVDFDLSDLAGVTLLELKNFVYSKTHFRCNKCGGITKKVKDEIGKASNWLCGGCK